jgi:hypothetical protein
VISAFIWGGFKSQIQERLVGLAQTVTEKPVESEERLAASLVSQFKMKGWHRGHAAANPPGRRIADETIP